MTILVENRGRPHRRRSAATAIGGGRRQVNYRHLRNPFPPVAAFTEDRIVAIHDTALRVLEELGMKVLLPEARLIFRAGGAIVDEENQIVRIGREIVHAALASAPRSSEIRAGAPDRSLKMELGTLAIQTGAGAPHATDLPRGRRPATLQDYRELTTLTQHFDVLHMLNPV